MSAITNLWGQLVQRRLWPVAILLIAAAVAVPLVLTQQPEPAPPAPAVAPDSGEAALAVQPIVAQATLSDRDKRRNVLGSRKNPFGLPEVEVPGSAAAPNSDGATTAQEPAGLPAPESSGGSTPVSGGGAPAAPSPTSGPAPRTYARHELTVRFSTGEETGELQRLKRLQALPSTEAPVLIYLGAVDDGKTAVFLLDKRLGTVGDGQCMPRADRCETLHMRAGDTEFLDVTDETGAVIEQYQLDLVKIHKTTTVVAQP